jgi:hypothetical protein
VDALTLFGLFAVTAMLVTYALESRSHWFILAFAAACVLGSIYGFLQGAWPFGLVEGIWAIVAMRRWYPRRQKCGPKIRGPLANQTRVALRQSLLTTILFFSRHSE